VLRATSYELSFVYSNSISIEVVGDPGDGAGEAFLEIYGGGPAEGLAGFGVVGEEAEDFGFFGAEAFFVLDDGQVGFVEDFED